MLCVTTFHKISKSSLSVGFNCSENTRGTVYYQLNFGWSEVVDTQVVALALASDNFKYLDIYDGLFIVAASRVPLGVTNKFRFAFLSVTLEPAIEFSCSPPEMLSEGRTWY